MLPVMGNSLPDPVRSSFNSAAFREASFVPNSWLGCQTLVLPLGGFDVNGTALSEGSARLEGYRGGRGDPEECEELRGNGQGVPGMRKFFLTLSQRLPPFLGLSVSWPLQHLDLEPTELQRTPVSLRLLHAVCRHLQSQAAFWSFLAGGLWVSELACLPRACAHAVPGPGMPHSPPPNLSPDAAASGGGFPSTPPRPLGCLH